MPDPLPSRPTSAYASVDSEYFQKRGLKRYARVWSLWALGVGAVISGDFFGWNFGLAAGGFGGLLIATILMTVMYSGLCASIAEMSPALPHAGGAYSFARSAMGPLGGFVTGMAENMEYILTPAVIVVGIGGYLGSVFGTPESYAPLWWLACYAVFVGLNIRGVEVSFKLTVAITFLALAILLVFFCGAATQFDFATFAFTIEPSPGSGHSSFLPRGWSGVLAALPFAMWFYLAIEELPLAAEESDDPVRDMPKGIFSALATLVVCAFLTLILSAGIAPGSDVLSQSDEPLFLSLRAIFGEGLGSRVLALIAVSGLAASFHSIIFAYGRQIFSLSRSGYFPRWLSLTHARYQTPHFALLVGAGLGFLAALGIHLLGSDHPVGAVLLNMAVFGAVLSYILQMVSFILLRRRYPHLPRPYRSPLGVPGAIVTLGISLVTLVSLFVSDPVYVRVTIGAAIWFGCGVLYYLLWARKNLVLAPEEQFAQSVANAHEVTTQ